MLKCSLSLDRSSIYSGTALEAMRQSRARLDLSKSLSRCCVVARMRHRRADCVRLNQNDRELESLAALRNHSAVRLASAGAEGTINRVVCLPNIRRAISPPSCSRRIKAPVRAGAFSCAIGVFDGVCRRSCESHWGLMSCRRSPASLPSWITKKSPPLAF